MSSGTVVRECCVCGANVRRYPSQLKGKKTVCSIRCRSELARKTITKPCEQCGQDVSRSAGNFGEHAFCSRACYVASPYFTSRRADSNARRYAGKRETRPCLACGKDVERAVSQFRARVFCSRACKSAHHVSDSRQINGSGYVRLFAGTGAPGADKSGHILEHRKVMQDYLGRALTPDENVHHMNGVRTDNRLENLELWSRSQPPGQRVVDKVKWAREFLALYPDDIG